MDRQIDIWRQEEIERAFAGISAELRTKLADLIYASLEDLVEYVRERTEGSDVARGYQEVPQAVLEDQAANVRAGSIMVAEWIRTGALPERESLEQLASVGRRVARVTGSFTRVVKANLAWRDGLCTLIARFCVEEGIGRELMEGLLIGVRRACDGSIVRSARNFDQQSREIEEELEAKRRQLEFLALHDPLTAVANRGLLFDRLENALERMRRHPERGPLAVFFLDLDNFKEFNDANGHLLGDEILQTVARRLSLVVRDHDTVARFGGDEFVILAEGVGDGEVVRSLAERIEKAVSEPISIGDRHVRVEASIGVKIVEDPNLKPDEVIVAADALMYAAKAKGGARAEIG